MKRTITTLAVFALAASLAFAAPQVEGHHHRGFMSQKMAQKLNLSDAQKQQIKDIKANDTAKLQQLQPTVDANKAQMKVIREQERAKILSVLTPEQRTQLDAWRAQ
jgi:Spy/CpxP family protein refolding chaperone